MRALEIPQVVVSDDQDGCHSRYTKPARDIVTRDDIRLFLRWESEDWDPGGEDVGECVHLDATVSFLALRSETPVTSEVSTNHSRDIRPLLGIMSIRLVHKSPRKASRRPGESSKVCQQEND